MDLEVLLLVLAEMVQPIQSVELHIHLLEGVEVAQQVAVQLRQVAQEVVVLGLK
jgi:hypothetical protein